VLDASERDHVHMKLRLIHNKRRIAGREAQRERLEELTSVEAQRKGEQHDEP
jgi:hypothetical protein